MRYTIFLSWQSDRPNAVGRTIIEACTNEAIKALMAEAEVWPTDRAIAFDKDTLGVPGSPSIVETIFRKIDRATVFLPNLTFVAMRLNGGGTPNPRASLEHGWALRALGPRRVISVMNTAIGNPKDHGLPLVLRNVKRRSSLRAPGLEAGGPPAGDHPAPCRKRELGGAARREAQRAVRHDVAGAGMDRRLTIVRRRTLGRLRQPAVYGGA